MVRRARDAFAEGDFRWVAQVVNHVVFADPTHAEALALQADALEQLGYGSENGTWRNFYLTGALELRRGPVGSPTTTASADFLRALSLDQLFDALSIRVDGPRSWDADITVRWNVTGGEPVTLRLRNGVLTHIAGTGPAVSAPDVEVALDEAALRAVLLGSLPRRNFRDAPPSPVTRRRSPNSSATSARRTRTSPSSLPDPTGHGGADRHGPVRACLVPELFSARRTPMASVDAATLRRMSDALFIEKGCAAPARPGSGDCSSWPRSSRARAWSATRRRPSSGR